MTVKQQVYGVNLLVGSFWILYSITGLFASFAVSFWILIIYLFFYVYVKKCKNLEIFDEMAQQNIIAAKAKCYNFMKNAWKAFFVLIGLLIPLSRGYLFEFTTIHMFFLCFLPIGLQEYLICYFFSKYEKGDWENDKKDLTNLWR